MKSTKEAITYLNKSWYISFSKISYWWTWIVVIFLVINILLITLGSGILAFIPIVNIFSTSAGVSINFISFVLLGLQLILNGIILWGAKVKFENRGGEEYSIFRYWFAFPSVIKKSNSPSILTKKKLKAK